MSHIKQSDLDEFFRFVLDRTLSVEQLISHYIQYHGNIDWGRQQLLVSKISEAAAAPLLRRDILGADGEILRTFISERAPALEGSYFEPGSPRILDHAEIFPATRNEWEDHSLPEPLNSRLLQANRPALGISSMYAPQLFASAYGYQAFDETLGQYYRIASSRAFSRSILKYPRRQIDRPVVVIQDQYDGGNSAHFLYDWIPRVICFAITKPGIARSCSFLVGGERNALHDLAIARLEEAYGISEDQYIFPSEKMILNLSGPLYVFSDQRSPISHPLYMGHPAIVRLTRSLFLKTTAELNTPRKIYVGRADASLRKLVNEEALVTALEAFGYRPVIMTQCGLAAQMSIISQADEIIAPHGMGLTYILFQQRIGSLLEIFHPSIGSDAYAFVAKSIGMRYRFLLGRDEDDKMAGYSVDVAAVAETISR